MTTKKSLHYRFVCDHDETFEMQNNLKNLKKIKLDERSRRIKKYEYVTKII